jgi:hypothetical protein
MQTPAIDPIHDTIPDDFYTRPTTRPPGTAPDPLRHVSSSLRPPALPSRLGPYTSVPEIALVIMGVAGAASCLYLGFEWAHHWDLGGWLGVEWFGSICLAGGLVGAALTTAITLWRLRRGE